MINYIPHLGTKMQQATETAQPVNPVSPTFDLNEALYIDWFEGDFGDGETRLSNKIVKGRKEHECHGCEKPIVKGELHRSMTEKVDGELESYRWCQKCCIAGILMADGHDAQ